MTQHDALTRAAAPCRQRRLGPGALIVLMAITAGGLCSPLLASAPGPVLHPVAPWPLLLVLWLPFELISLHLQYGDDPDNADTFVLTEIPLALGLLMCSPAALVAVGVGTSVLVDLVRHRPGVTKQLFNAVNRALEIGVAMVLYRALDAGPPLSLSGWLALCVALTTSTLVTSLLVSLVIRLATGRASLAELLSHSLIALPMAPVGATAAFSSALLLRGGWDLAPPFVASLGALLLLMRGLTFMTERHVSLIRLHALAQRLSSAADVPTVVTAALDMCRDLMGSTQATAFLPAGDGHDLVKVTEGLLGEPHFARVARREVPQERGVVHRGTTVVASAPLPAGREVVLVVAGRRAPVRPFRRGDGRVLELVAHQVAQALHTAHLIDKLRRDALHDPLTGLPNRHSVVAQIEKKLAQQERFLVVSLGLQDVVQVNTALGHDHGDRLLLEVARRLRSASDPTAIVARVADDTFTVVLPGQSSRPVTRLLSELARPFTASGSDVFVRACAGVAAPSSAAAAAKTTPGAQLLLRADIAMRHARATGADTATYVAGLETTTAAELSLAADLRSGIGRGELVLHAQPQVRLADGAVVGVEALVRWDHPTLGLLQPGAFLPVAERSGLEAPLTTWVLEAAIATLAGWRDDGLQVTMSVNVPASSLSSRELCRQVERVLLTHRVPADQLVVEITESGLFTNTSAAAEVLTELAGLGVRISIDDFGTGFSSMSRLRHLPVDEVKIDRSFVKTMLEDRNDEAIVRSVIELARSLGLVCVAEGIEDAEVYAALRRWGCHLGQGYLVARPMPVADVPGWLAHAPVVDVPGLDDCDGRPRLAPARQDELL